MQTRRSLDLSGRKPQPHVEALSASPRGVARSGSPSWHRRGAALGLSALLTVSLSGCAGLPQLEHSDTATSADACTSSLLSAQKLDKDSTESPVLGIAGRAVAAKSAAAAWLKVANQCSTRFSEATVKAGAAQHRVVILADRAGWKSLADTDSANSSDALSADAIASISDSDADISILRDMAVAHDRAAYAFEVLAARESPLNTGFEQLSLDHRRTATEFAEAALACSAHAKKSEECSTTDPRKKVYSIKGLMNGNATIVDAASGLQTSTAASLEMSCALEELSAATDTEAHDKTALAAYISNDIAAAYAQGYPSTPLPLTAQAS